MKKIISVIVSLCLLMSMTAFAETQDGKTSTTDAVVTMTADKDTVKPGDTITYTVHITKSSDGKAFQSGTMWLFYDATQITIDTSSVVYSPAYSTQKATPKTSTKYTPSTYILFQNTATKAADYEVGAFDIFKFTATVNADAEDGDIVLSINQVNTFKVTNQSYSKDSVTLKLDNLPTVTVASVKKPVITLNAANAGNGIVKGNEVSYNETTGELKYKVTVETMPIGATAAYVVVNGDTDNKIAISGGVYEATYTANTTLTVAYDYDETNAITYSKIADGDGYVVFGKGPKTATEYGFVLDGTWNKFTNDSTSADVSGNKFPAAYNDEGVFAVKFTFNEKATGTYTAYAYADETVDTNGIVVYTAE